jgi:hypothetical protein
MKLFACDDVAGFLQELEKYLQRLLLQPKLGAVAT